MTERDDLEALFKTLVFVLLKKNAEWNKVSLLPPPFFPPPHPNFASSFTWQANLRFRPKKEGISTLKGIIEEQMKAYTDEWENTKRAIAKQWDSEKSEKVIQTVLQQLDSAREVFFPNGQYKDSDSLDSTFALTRIEGLIFFLFSFSFFLFFFSKTKIEN